MNNANSLFSLYKYLGKSCRKDIPLCLAHTTPNHNNSDVYDLGMDFVTASDAAVPSLHRADCCRAGAWLSAYIYLLLLCSH